MFSNLWSPSEEHTSFLVLLADGEVLLHVIGRSQDHRDPLVDGGGLDVQDVDRAGGGHASGLLHDVSHGVALVQQPQLKGSKWRKDFDDQGIGRWRICVSNNSSTRTETHLALGAFDICRV